MKFSELIKLPCCSNRIIDFDSLKSCIPETPDLVIRQFYSDHGWNSEFQQAYGSLEIDKIVWDIKSVKASEILNCDIRSECSNYHAVIDLRWGEFESLGFHDQTEIDLHWRVNKTWTKPPVFLSGFCKLSTTLHLAEGQTRYRTLYNSVKYGKSSIESYHQIFIGTIPRSSAMTKCIDPALKGDAHG